MANVTAYKNKDGVIVSYRFRACIGRDEKGKQQFVTKTEKPPVGLTPKKAENGRAARLCRCSLLWVSCPQA